MRRIELSLMDPAGGRRIALALALCLATASSAAAGQPRVIMIGHQPYRVVDSIAELADAVAHKPNGRYALGGDYDATADGTYRKAPVQTTFTGTFHGLNHTISHLAIQSLSKQTGVGLFASIGPGGTVRDLTLAYASIAGRAHAAVGALAGGNGGTIIDVHASGSVSGTNFSHVGGLVGGNSGNVVRCSWTGAVEAGNQALVGGLVGKMSAGLIQRSHADGNVGASNRSTAGGLVASAANSTIVDSYATGAVRVSSSGDYAIYVGGLVGDNAGEISFSFATGAVGAGCCGGTEDGDAGVGGLVGNNSGSIHDAYTTGAAQSEEFATVGGSIGVNTGSVETTYSTGLFQIHDSGGGLIGFDNGSPTASSYWDLDTSGISDPSQGAGNVANDPGITGLTDTELKSGLPAGFDPAVWGSDPGINNGWPYLLAVPPP